MQKDEKQGIVVIRRDHESLESMIRRFKKKVNFSGIFKELKNGTFYEKPSVARKRKRNEAISRRKKEEQKQIKKLKFKNGNRINKNYNPEDEKRIYKFNKK